MFIETMGTFDIYSQNIKLENNTNNESFFFKIFFPSIILGQVKKLQSKPVIPKNENWKGIFAGNMEIITEIKVYKY